MEWHKANLLRRREDGGWEIHFCGYLGESWRMGGFWVEMGLGMSGWMDEREGGLIASWIASWFWLFAVSFFF